MNLQHKFKSCLYLQNVLIKYIPPILTGLFHNTLHTLILAMLIAPFVYYLKIKISFLVTTLIHFHLHPWISILKLSAVPWQWFLGPAQKKVLQLPVMKDATVSRYYKNFRATKFNKPPCLYKVISTSFSNDAITLNSFPVLVFIFNVILGKSSSGNDKENTSLPERPKESAFSPGRNSSGAIPIPIKWSLCIFS